jgi:serine protease AprX
LHRIWFSVAALALALVVGAGAAASAKPPEPAPVVGTAGALNADLDGDRLFDDLEARLARLGSAERLSVIVRFGLPVADLGLAQLKAQVGGFATTHRFTYLNGFAAELTASQIRLLMLFPGVLAVEENLPVHALNDTAQSSFGVSQARTDAGVDGDGDNNAATYSKSDLVAAVIDTGIDAAHQDLDEGKVIGFANCIGGCRLAAPVDDHGHGTHVAATIAGEGDARSDLLYRGVAPGAALVGVKVLDAGGNGTSADVAAGIEWVIANKDVYGIEAINLSLGSSGCSNGTDAESTAVNRAAAAGIVVVVAAGNAGPGTCTIGSPGAAADGLTVGAMADMGVNGFKQASFSSRGKTADGRIKPDVSAPGVNITSADAGTPTAYTVLSGTSMATPFTVGTALLMRDANPALTPQEVKDRIRATAVDWGRGGDNRTLGSRGADIDYGAGRLDGYAAVQAAKGSVIGTGPLTPEHLLREGTLAGTGAVVDYPLSVTNTQFPIAATLIHAGVTGGTASSPDFDLYLYNPAGVQIATAQTTRRQDEIGFKPTVTGTYTLRVRSYAGSGDFFVDISAGMTTPLPPLPPPPPPADQTAPSVTAVSPVEGATAVSVGTNVTVTFSEPMDQPATQAAFTLNGPGAVAGSFSWSGSTMTFDPTAGLAASTTYTARVTTAAKDAAGNPLTAEKLWSFATAAAPVGPVAVTASPGAATVETGAPRSGAAANLGADDDVYYQVSSTTTGSRTTAWYGSFTGVSNALSNLRVSYTGKNSRSCTQRVEIWRWTTSAWVQLNSQTVGGNDVAITSLAPAGTLADYVSGTTGDGELRIRIRCTTTTGSFFSSGDLLRIAYNRP